MDASQSAYSITTEQAGDPPEVGTLGAMNTGFHGCVCMLACYKTLLTLVTLPRVTLHTLSIAHLLDVEYDENISLDECLDRNQRDAATRNVVWDADDLVESVTDEDAKLKTLEPVGIRDEQGRLRTIAEVEHDEKLKDVRLKVGLVVDEKEQVVLPRGEADLAESSTVLSDNAALQKAVRRVALRVRKLVLTVVAPTARFRCPLVLESSTRHSTLARRVSPEVFPPTRAILRRGARGLRREVGGGR